MLLQVSPPVLFSLTLSIILHSQNELSGITSIVQPEIGGIEAGVLGFISAIAGLMADKE